MPIIERDPNKGYTPPGMAFNFPTVSIEDFRSSPQMLSEYAYGTFAVYSYLRDNASTSGWTNLQTGIGAFNLANDVKIELINYAAKSSPAINEMGYVKAVKAVSKSLFVTQVGISGYETYNAFKNGDPNAWGVAGKAGLDATIGYISLVGGPIGWGIGGVYFIGDAAGWWGNWGQPALTSPLNINKR